MEDDASFVWKRKYKQILKMCHQAMLNGVESVESVSVKTQLK